MIITIDGPAASGKSTLASLVAQRTESFYINSGLLFRALAFSMLMYVPDPNTLIHDQNTLDDFIKQFFTYDFSPATGPVVRYKDQDITTLLKTPEVSSYASVIAAEPVVREALLIFQRRLAENQNVIADGRDCGTVVFPYATYKFFITADENVRAQRLQKDLTHQNTFLSLEESKALLHERDTRDTTRSHAPLQAAPDAYCIDNSLLSVEETLNCILSHLRN
ncbi:(d)CMP kinase [Candidatus Dependentiae bacterium]|nr:(d)CMP kinase [Candidatus Dependentiae bacterium]